jgi:YXWGXW repeat-containing protein
MFRRGLMVSVFAFLLSGGTYAASVVVRIAPPAPIVETRPLRPGPRHVWVDGYHRWGGREYVWVPGYWAVPPRHHAHWVRAHWVHRRGGWVLVEGHWRG